MPADLDNEVRLAVYRHFVERGEPPTAAEVGAALDIGTDEAGAAFRRLEESHVLVLSPATLDVWMANPQGVAHFAVPAARWWDNVAQAWYADRMSPDWRRRTPAETEAVFASIGLTGPFWKLAP